LRLTSRLLFGGSGRVFADGLKFVEDFQAEIGRKVGKLGLGGPSDLDVQSSCPPLMRFSRGMPPSLR
jgi:hypothetical protein